MWMMPLHLHVNQKSDYDYDDDDDSSVPIKEVAIKIPFKIRSPKVSHGDHDFFVWSSSIYTPE